MKIEGKAFTRLVTYKPRKNPILSGSYPIQSVAPAVFSNEGIKFYLKQQEYFAQRRKGRQENL